MLVEREEPLKELLKCASTARGGRGVVVTVLGEAGIGKTSLVEEFRLHAGADCTFFWGACDALYTPRPLGPVRDMAAAFGGPVNNALADAVPTYELFASIMQELKNRDEPSVLVIEDAHWADHATLDFIRFLGRRISLLNAVLVISYRDDELDDEHALRKIVSDLPPASVRRIPLQPLTPKGVKTLCADKPLDSQAIFDVTAGNPFFVAEMLAAGNGQTKKVPASVKDAVSGRVARLGENERAFLETISVIPGPVQPAVVEAIFGADGETFVMACVGRNLLMHGSNGTLRFRHELARLATLARLSASRLKLIHRRVLDAYDSSAVDPPIDQLVHHAAGALDGARVLTLAPRAALAATVVGAHQEAAAHLRTALEFVDEAEPEAAAALYQQWAYEAGLAERIDDEVLEARRHALTLWRALERPDKVGENLRWLSRLHWYRGEAQKAQKFADEAVRVLETAAPSAERAMAYSLRSQIHMLNDRMDEAVEWGKRGLELAEQYNNTEAQVHALNNIGTAQIFRGKTEGVARMRASLALALDCGMHEHAARVYTNLSEYAVEFRDFTLAEETLSKGIAFDTRHDLVSWTHYLVGRQAQLRLEQGRLRDAETIANGVLQLPQLTLLMRLPALIVYAKTRLRMGEEDGTELLQKALQDAKATDEVQYLVPIRLGLIEAAWLNDDKDAAQREIASLTNISVDQMHSWNIGELANWAKRCNTTLPPEFSQLLPAPWQLELDGDHGAAAAAWEALGAPYSSGMAILSAGKQLSAEALRQCIKTFRTIEATAGENKARALASAGGLSGQMPRKRRGPYQAARHHPLGLTKREQEVLGLVCLGNNNIEISAKLSRSKKTIEHHVSSILRKMDVSNRMEVMLRVQNEPWLMDA